MASKARASRGAGDGQDEEYQRTLAGLTAYAKDKVEVVLKQMLNELFIATPEDPVQVSAIRICVRELSNSLVWWCCCSI